jgi:hypothetical protein
VLFCAGLGCGLDTEALVSGELALFEVYLLTRRIFIEQGRPVYFHMIQRCVRVKIHQASSARFLGQRLYFDALNDIIIAH